MYNKPMLSLEQCRAAMNAMIDEYRKVPNRRPIDMTIVDDMGNLIMYARTDGLYKSSFGMRKAYTAAIRGMDTSAFAEGLQAQGRSLADLGDPQLITLPGGVVVRTGEDVVVGGIGVGGLTGEEDEAIAKVGLKALGV